MTKNCLSFFGLIFLTIIVLVSVGLMAYFYRSIGLISVPEGLLPTELPFEIPSFADVSVDYPNPAPTVFSMPEMGEAEWSNPLDLLPTETLAPIPEPTATPIPPLAPEVYQAQVMARLKDFAAAMERWVTVNDRLAQDAGLREDINWQTEAKVNLERITATAQSLAAVGPAPAEYQFIDAWLKRIPGDSAALQGAYLSAIETGNTQDFIAAGEHFKQIKEDLNQAVQAMLALGWTFQ